MIMDYLNLKLPPLTLIICSGNYFVSRKIKWFNYLAGVKGAPAQATHGAILVNNRVYESTTLNKWAKKKGVQDNPFSEWLENYNGKVWLRPMRFDMPDDILLHKFERSWSRIAGRKYESGIPGLIELLWTGFRKHKILSTGRLHCTESVVIVLQHMDLFRTLDDNMSNILAGNFPPHTFWQCGDFDRNLKGSIGEITRIK